MCIDEHHQSGGKTVFAFIYIVESRGDTSGHYLLPLSVEVFYVKVDDRPVKCILLH